MAQRPGRTAVIGAGASGLSLALMLDDDVVVYERRERPGGHCQTTIRDGWTFDQGPHIMFSRDADVLAFMVDSLHGNVHTSKRENRVFVAGRCARYPFENDLAALPPEARASCLLDYLFATNTTDVEPTNLDEWFVKNFGPAMTDLYFRPYNEKVWNIPLDQLSMLWSDRIPLPPPEDVVRGALGITTEGYLHQLYYQYPLHGGYEAIARSWAEALPTGTVRLSESVDKIVTNPDGVEIVTANGSESFERVVYTAPLRMLDELVDDVPDSVRDAVASLRVNPIVTVTLGYAGPDPNGFTAVYFPDPEFLPNRVSAPTVFSPENGPTNHYSLQAEITFPPGDDYLGPSSDGLVTHVHAGLVTAGLVDERNEPVFVDVQRVRDAYVVYTHDYTSALEVVRAWAATRGIVLHGRFGAFEYLNVDGCVLRSVELATMLNGRPTHLEEAVAAAGITRGG